MPTEEPNGAPLTELGALLVRVSTAGIFLPVEGADVRIVGASPENREVRYLLTTDRSGLAERIELPTPAAALSQSPGNAPGFSLYDIEVFKEGFYPATYLGVPLFPGVTAVQRVEMIPLPPYRPEEYPPKVETDFTEEEPLYNGGAL